MKRKKNTFANLYRVLHNDVTRILDFYKLEEDMSFRDFLDEYYGRPITVIIPIMNRNGFYQSRKTGFTWMEIDGVAFTEKSMKSQFNYDLERLNEKVYSRREIAAMEQLVKMNTLSAVAMKEIRQALYNDYNRLQLRRIMMDGLRCRKRITAFIKQVENLGVDK